jgi:hypothetical protein
MLQEGNEEKQDYESLPTEAETNSNKSFLSVIY